MSNVIFFLGVEVDAELDCHFHRNNPHLVSLLIGGGDYLSKMYINQTCYIGKPLPPSPTINELESIEIHLLSLLKKLAPDYNYSQNQPVLITCASINT